MEGVPAIKVNTLELDGVIIMVLLNIVPIVVVLGVAGTCVLVGVLSCTVVGVVATGVVAGNLVVVWG